MAHQNGLRYQETMIKDIESKLKPCSLVGLRGAATAGVPLRSCCLIVTPNQCQKAIFAATGSYIHSIGC